MFTPDGQPPVYDSISCMAFVNGYLAIMAGQNDTLKNKMAIHLQEMMEDRETWPVVCAYHMARLQHLGQAGLLWKMKSPG